MIFIDRRFKRMQLRYYLCSINGFSIEWIQNVNREEKVVGIGWFNQHKNFYNYEKKGYGDAMYRRVAGFANNLK